MLIITKENNSIKVVGQNNPTYPYSGTLVYPLNSVTVVTDQSNMAVFRSALNNDVLFTGLIDDITIAGSPVTKEDIGTKFGEISNSASSTGGTVDSVNGHTGNVVLTANDVNAYTKEESDGKYATKAEIPSTDNLATKEELALKADKSSLGNYLLKSEAQSTYETISGAQGKYQAKLTAGTGIEINGENVINVTLDTNIYQVVESLPESEINPNKIYLVLSEKSGETNLYTEYLYVNNKWEEIGKYKADVDLTPYLKSSDAASTYATKAELGAKLDTATYNSEKTTFATKTEIPDVSNLATKTELSEGLAGKANTSDLNNYLTTANAQSTYATKSELGAKLDVETYNSDKATFALKSELPDTSSFITKATADETYQPKGEYLTSVPDNYVTDEELNGKGYATTEQLNGKQDTLVSGTNIKTINGNTILGEGNIQIETTGGGITDAPSDDKTYGRKNGAWSEITEPDLSNYALKSEVPTKYVQNFTGTDTGFQILQAGSSDARGGLTFGEGFTVVNLRNTPSVSIDTSVIATVEALNTLISRVAALETQMGEVSSKLDTLNGEVI